MQKSFCKTIVIERGKLKIHYEFFREIKNIS